MIRSILRAREELVADALAAEGLDVARTRLASIEPRGDGTVAGVSATIRTTTATEERLVYIDDSRHPVALWVHPDDPRLPALAPAAFADSLAVLLARMGLDGPVAELRMVAYRPTRRAVLEATCGGRRVFVKVVRPERAEPIIRRHRVLREAGLPVPRVLGWSPAGIMVIEPAHGLALADAVEHVDPVVVVRELDALRARLAAVRGLEATGRPSVSGRAPWYASQLTERMPRLVERLEPLVRCAVRAEASRVPQDIGHGDLHAGQVFVDDAGRVTGLIDVDTTGPVPPGADAGALTAHALASARMAERSGDGPGRRRAAAFRALARAAGDAWLHPHGARQAHQASAQAVGHLLAQAVQAAVSWQDEVGAIALVADAEAILACSRTDDGPAPDGGAEDERALIGGSRVAHTRTRT